MFCSCCQALFCSAATVTAMTFGVPLMPSRISEPFPQLLCWPYYARWILTCCSVGKHKVRHVELCLLSDGYAPVMMRGWRNTVEPPLFNIKFCKLVPPLCFWKWMGDCKTTCWPESPDDDYYLSLSPPQGDLKGGIRKNQVALEWLSGDPKKWYTSDA